jgi:hypothetical protein
MSKAAWIWFTKIMISWFLVGTPFPLSINDVIKEN